MIDQKTSYRSAIKGTVIFGGVQFFIAIISIIRAKFVAILIGTQGMGIAALFNSSVGLLGQIISFGISYSGVRDLAKAGADNDTIMFAKTFVVINRILWFTGFLGVVLTIIFASQLSFWTFGNYDYTWSFIWLSIAVLFNNVAQGLNSLLQGARHLRHLAKSSVIGSVVGLAVNVPLYYFYGIDGIVPAIIIASATTFLLAFYFSRKIEVISQQVSLKETIQKSKHIIKLGLALVFTGFISMLIAYLMNLFLQHTAGEATVGLYQSGWVLTTQYVGLIFTAMATDFFPRLSAVHDDKEQVGLLTNQQIQIGQLIIAPIAIGLLVFAPLVVYVLLSSEFFPTIPLIQFSLMGMLFKTASWAISFVILAKGNTSLFLIIETFANFLLLGLNVIGYTYCGLAGIGYAFIALYVIYFAVVWLIARRRYGFCFEAYTIRLFVIQQIFFVLVLAIILFTDSRLIQYICGGLLLAVSIFYSYRELNKLIGFKELMMSRFKR